MSNRALIIVLLLLSLAIGAVFLIRGGARSPGDGAASRLPGFDAAKVVSITVAPAPGRPREIIERTDIGGWALRIEGAPFAPWPVIPARVRGLLSVLDRLPLQPAPSADAARSLPQDATTVVFGHEDGADSTLRIAPGGVGGRRLIETGDGDRFYIEEDLHAVFTSPGPRGWRDTSAMPGVGAGVSRLEVATPERSIRLERAGPRWIMLLPIAARADAGAVERLITAVSSIAIDRFLDEGAPTRESAGLLAPALAIRAVTVARRLDEQSGDARQTPHERTLSIGAPADIGGATLYASPDEGATVFVIGAESVSKIPLDPLTLIDRRASAVLAADIAGLAIETSEGARRFTRTAQGWVQDERDASTAAVAEADIAEVIALLTGAAAARIPPGAPADLRPIGSIALLGFDGGPLETHTFGAAGQELVIASHDVPGAESAIHRAYAAPVPALLRPRRAAD